MLLTATIGARTDENALSNVAPSQNTGHSR